MPKSQSCCGNNVIGRVGVCCGDFAVFDPASEICCNNQYVFPGDPSKTECCIGRNVVGINVFQFSLNEVETFVLKVENVL